MNVERAARSCLNVRQLYELFRGPAARTAYNTRHHLVKSGLGAVLRRAPTPEDLIVPARETKDEAGRTRAYSGTLVLASSTERNFRTSPWTRQSGWIAHRRECLSPRRGM